VPATSARRRPEAKGVDEIWCISVNDAFVMGAWGRDQKATGVVRMMADGNAAFSKALGLDADFSKHGMGTRSQRYSMLVDNGVVTQLNVEQGGKLKCRMPRRCWASWLDGQGRNRGV
jgi:peroxiredoxin